MTAAVAKEFAHRARGIRRDVKQRRRLRRAGGDDDAVAQCVGFFEDAHDLRNGGLLLPDRVVNADDVFVVLIDDGVDRDGRLAGLAVADDQLALAASDRHHRVDGFQAGLQRLAHRLAIDHAWCDALDRHERLCGDGALAVDGLPERIHHAAEQLVADRHRDDAPGALDDVAFLDFRVLAEEHRAHAVLFEVQRDAEDAVRKLEHLAGHRALDAVHSSDTVAKRHNAADFGDVDLDGKTADLVADDFGDFFSFDFHCLFSFQHRDTETQSLF